MGECDHIRDDLKRKKAWGHSQDGKRRWQLIHWRFPDYLDTFAAEWVTHFPQIRLEREKRRAGHQEQPERGFAYHVVT
jgi:hypothetical protein